MTASLWRERQPATQRGRTDDRPRAVGQTATAVTSRTNIVGSRATKPYRPDAIVLATNQFANMVQQTWDFRDGDFVGIVIPIYTSSIWGQLLDAK